MKNINKKAKKSLKPEDVNRHVIEMEPDFDEIFALSVFFGGESIKAFDVNGQILVSIQSFLEKLDVDYGSQARKIRSDDRYKPHMIRFLNEDGAKKKFLCVPVRFLGMLLMTINTKKVKASSREKVRRFQDDCSASTLNAYFVSNYKTSSSKKAGYSSTTE